MKKIGYIGTPLLHYKFNCTDPGLQLGDPAPCTHWFVAVDLLTFYIVCTREDKGDREGIPHTHPIPWVIRLELFLESG